MINTFRIILLSLLVVPVTSCGVKGKLKTPDQIKKEEAKAVRAEEKKKLEEEKKSEAAEQK